MAQIGSTTVLADIKSPSLKYTTRWDYVSRYLETWVDARQSRTYAIVSALVAAILLLRAPFFAVFPAAAAAYFYTNAQLRNYVLNSQRKIILVD
jgi:hypothetical protein